MKFILFKKNYSDSFISINPTHIESVDIWEDDKFAVMVTMSSGYRFCANEFDNKSDAVKMLIDIVKTVSGEETHDNRFVIDEIID